MQSDEDFNRGMMPMLDLRAVAIAAVGTDGANSVLSNVELSLRATFFPLGFPVEIATNSPAVLAAAEQSWRLFRPQFDFPPLRVELGVAEDEPGMTDLPPAPVCRVREHLLTNVADGGNFVACDLKHGFAFGWVTRSTADSPLYLRYHFLEAAVLAMLSTLRAAALHAACVAPYGHGMLLCGDSGAGKSSLAFAGARSGWTYISDDSTYLPLDRGDRLVVGNSHQIRFRDSGVQLFPELEGRSITPRATGKPSIEVSTLEFPELITSDSARVEYIVFLNRRNAATPGLHPCSRESALRWFLQASLLSAGAAAESGVRNLVGVEVFELRYTDLDWAVERLEQLALTGR
jgi:hypothetical protein